GVSLDTFAMGGIIRSGNGLSGVISKAIGVKIGGTAPGAGNSIGSNVGPGVKIDGPAAESNEVMGNFIGAIRNVQGAVLSSANGGDGVLVSGSSLGTKIGGTVGGAANTILNNAGNGILVEAGDESITLRYRAGGIPPTVIEGNDLGVTLDTFAMGGGIIRGGNGLAGVISKAVGVKIGGTGAGAGNSVGANVGPGIQIDGPAAESNEVIGNFIGAMRNLQGAILTGGGNGGDGVLVSGGSVGTKIGGTVGGAANTILNNAGNGIHVEAGDQRNTLRYRAGGIPPTVIEGNNLGVSLDTFAMGGIIRSGNGLSGVISKAIGVKIGGTGAGAGNSIGANIGSGVQIDGSVAELNEVMGNMIGGLRVLGGLFLPAGNGGDGVRVGGGAGNKIGGNVAAAANTIINNAGNGVTITGAAATDNEVHGNLIGTTTATIPEDFPLGAATTGNGQDGIVVRDAPRPQIGRADTSYRNVVAFNAGNGVRVDSASGTYSSPVYVYGNDLVGNAMNGILTTVQHDMPHIMEGNTVRSNTMAGIKMANSNRNEVIQNRVENNTGIGVILDGIQTTLINVRNNIINENGSHGVDIDNGANTNNIGGSAPNQGNTITNNGGNGIRLGPGAGSGNNLDPNIIFGNTLGGIDLGGDGFTLNDPTDADSGPNNLQNYPTLTVTITGGDLIVSYQVDSAPANSVYGATGIRAEFFEANAVGEGSNFLGFDIYTTQNYANGTPGTKQINLGNAAALGFVPGDRMTATATDTAGNSSEFTPAVTAPGGLGFEGDVTPRPNGDGNMLSTDITQMRRFVSGLDTPNPSTNEAQRIDCAPRSTFGDGIMNSSDVVQGRRYVSGLDVLTPAGGPASRGGSVPESVFIPSRDSGMDPFQRELRIGEPQFRRSSVLVPIELASHGNEVAMSFTLEYDPDIFSNPRISLGKFAPAGSTLTVNSTEPGRIGILIDSSNAMIASSLPLSIVSVSFDAKEEASGEAPIYLTGSLAAKGISDAFGNSLSTTYLGGVVRFAAKIY
ncbi:MAG: right-handed parallel beta-helix repeat-containing protein, partial [Pyrinomonadaceae bacterium]